MAERPAAKREDQSSVSKSLRVRGEDSAPASCTLTSTPRPWQLPSATNTIHNYKKEISRVIPSYVFMQHVAKRDTHVYLVHLHHNPCVEGSGHTEAQDVCYREQQPRSLTLCSPQQDLCDDNSAGYPNVDRRVLARPHPPLDETQWAINGC